LVGWLCLAVETKGMIAMQAATIVLLSSSNKILMQLRDDGNGKSILYPNMWNFPGGEKEADESRLECAVREVKEEFNLDISSGDCEEVFFYQHDNIDDTIYFCRVEGEPKPELHEGAAVEWMSLKEIKKLNLGFEQHKIIPHIERYLDSAK
jgi:8-oxo-dGTP pyrophosphatase MutT (NUDIX family)